MLSSCHTCQHLRFDRGLGYVVTVSKLKLKKAWIYGGIVVRPSRLF